jgi:hypothetical protein
MNKIKNNIKEENQKLKDVAERRKMEIQRKEWLRMARPDMYYKR